MKFELNFDLSLPTSKYSSGINSMRYVMLHHTGSEAPSVNQAHYLAQSTAQVSVHYTVGWWWEIRKHADDNKVCRHAGLGSGYWIANNTMNYHSIGIEVCSNWYWYNDTQRQVTKLLIQYLMRIHSIPHHNVIRHLDRTTRKRDIGDNFRNGNYRDRQDYQNKLLPQELEEKLRLEATYNYVPVVQDKKLKKVLQVLTKYVEKWNS